MPPKKKGSSKKPPKAMTPTLIDGLSKDEMSKEQLEEHIVRLREELDREREERNYFQLERDKIHSFWKITERQLEEVKAEQKNFDQDIEEDEGRHQVEIKVYKQKMKHLLCEHQNTISELRADALVSTQAGQKEQGQLEAQLHKDMKAIMVDKQEHDNENLVKELDLTNAEEITEIRDSLEKKLAGIQAKYEKKMDSLPLELYNMRKQETSQREALWNIHINNVIEDHNQTFKEAKALVNSMPQDLDTNDTVKLLIQAMKCKQKQKLQDLTDLWDDNKRLTELLSNVKENIVKKEKQIHNYTKKTDFYEKLKKNELDDQKRECETMEQKFSKLQQERDELYKTFTENVQKVQHKGNLKSSLLELKLEGLTESVEKTQAQLFSVISASNMDQTAINGVTNKIEEYLDSSNNSIKKLQNKRAQIYKARKDLLLTYEAKQRSLRVSVEGL
ncbi:dynein regulatory complex subunit 4 [Pseudochaenichthys georgianus]|uniref:dynein regulatory complex subunit 4 n=1 Tax=Pseudochaenichthys georgianus TaxID=52239 RepID=UPI00146F0FC7|nr:dynein regulatory complex subunit 4 [Pseudochaenichthys georgianus]